MNILVVHPYYLREGEPGGTRFNDFARHWRAEGHDVRVVASSVSYDSGARDRHGLGFGWPWSSERDASARIRRAWTFAHRGGARSRRLLSMFGFGITGAAAALAHPFWRPDVVLASSPTLTAAIPGMLAASAFGCPFVFEVRDLWPESAVTTGVVAAESSLVKAAEGLEEAACELADLVVALTPGIRDDIVARGLAPPERVTVIPNGVDFGSLPEVDREAVRRQLGWDDRFVAIYTGAHGVANRLDQVLDAAEMLAHRRDVLFSLVGRGPEKERLMRAARRRGLGNVEWHDAVAPERAHQMVAAANAALVVLQENPTFLTVYPNKLFDAMAAEVPIICAVDGVARELVMQAQAGVFVRPEKPDELARAVAGLAADPVTCLQLGWSGRAFAEDRFDRRDHAADYLDLFGALA